MKLAVSAKGTQLTDEVDHRFGRASYFLVVDLDNNSVEVLDNSSNVNALKGAGIKAASTLCDKDINTVMTGYCGPKAFLVLEKAGIKVIGDIEGTVAQAIEKYKSGNFVYSSAANAEAHW